MPTPAIKHDDTRDPNRTVKGLGLIIAGALIIGLVFWLSTGPSFAKTPRPIAAPAALVAAREQCPLDQPLRCRAALVHALAAVSWQRGENLKLARAMVGNVTAWSCIHGGEGSWTDTRDPYWGGLQMDKPFMREYGRDMLAKHHGGLADTWTPREQIIVAQRAFAQGRGYAPWPNTSRACGLR